MNRTAALPQVNETLCTLCGLCAEVCPCHSVSLADRRPIFTCPDACIRVRAGACNCTCLCEEVCPTGAISCAYEIVLGSGQSNDAPSVR